MSDVTTIEADVPERYADAVSARLRTADDDDVVGRLWRKDGDLWAPEGTPEVTNRLGWLDIAERTRAQLDELNAFRDELLRRGLHRRRGARHGRLEPRAGGLPAVVRQGRERPDPARAGLHAPGRGPEVPRHAPARDDARDRLLEVRRHDRADVDVQGLQRSAWTARTSSRSPTPAARLEELAQQGRLPARLLRRPGHRRALQRARARSASSPRSSRATTSPPCSIPRSAPPRSAAASGATRACGSAPRSASSARQGRDKLTFVADAPLSSYGVWAEQLVAESTGKLGRGILPIADEPLLAPSLRRRPRLPARRARRRAQRTALASAQGRRPSGDHGPRARPRRPRPDLLPERVRGRRRGLGAGAQPVRPAQRARGQGQHQPGPRGGFGRRRGGKPR